MESPRRNPRFARRRPAVAARAAPVQAAIFVTVGTELPFDRLVRAVDTWAASSARSAEVFAQIGRSDYEPANVRWARFLDGSDFRRIFQHAELIVAHAGMGTILAALELGRPLIVVPRRAELGEHRNDHQLATVTHLSERGLVNVAEDESEVTAYLDRQRDLRIPRSIGETATDSLLDAVRAAIRRPSDRADPTDRSGLP